MTKLESIKKHGESAQGRKELLRYLKGKTLTVHQAVLARCYDCMSYYADGVADCKSLDCPLYEYMPYRALTRKKVRCASKKPVNNAMQKKSSNGKTKNSRARSAAHAAGEKLPAKVKKMAKERGPKVPAKTAAPSKNKLPEAPVHRKRSAQERSSKKKSPQPLPLF
ncbi:MAG: hypothetical protein AB1553_08735 [Nitrospirota bacterium]